MATKVRKSGLSLRALAVITDLSRDTLAKRLRAAGLEVGSTTRFKLEEVLPVLATRSKVDKAPGSSDVAHARARLFLARAKALETAAALEIGKLVSKRQVLAVVETAFGPIATQIAAMPAALGHVVGVQFHDRSEAEFFLKTESGRLTLALRDALELVADGLRGRGGKR